MYQPETYFVSLLLMILSMLCWGSWANTVKLCPGYRFQLFYWDYVLGLILGALVWGFSLGSFGMTGLPFFSDLRHAGMHPILLAITGGVIFNIANLLLVAAIDIAGLAVAFPVGIGLALIVGAVTSYVIAPKGNPILLFGGITLVVAAIVFDAIAYRLRETSHRAMSKRGLIISLISGLLMGTFYPFVSKAMTGPEAAGPYAAMLYFSIGVAICAIPVNYLLMRIPLDAGEPASMSGYWQARASWHVWGILGGAIWCTGALMNFLASQAHIVGPAVSYSIGQGATMISAGWGVFIWREFAAAPSSSTKFLTWMFILFLCGLTAIAVVPLF
jgi:glucose uptake protein